MNADDAAEAEAAIADMIQGLVVFAKDAYATKDMSRLNDQLALVASGLDINFLTLMLRQLLIDYVAMGSYFVPKLIEVTGMTAEQIMAEARARA